MDVSKVTRFEVITEGEKNNRAFIAGYPYGMPIRIELSLQDDGRTLKVFVKLIR
jgi:hypothetical protein